MINTLKLLIGLNEVCHFMSRERTGKASNSELRRWCKNQAVVINGKRAKWDDEFQEIKSLVLFPRNPVTLF